MRSLLLGPMLVLLFDALFTGYVVLQQLVHDDERARAAFTALLLFVAHTLAFGALGLAWKLAGEKP